MFVNNLSNFICIISVYELDDHYICDFQCEFTMIFIKF